MYTNYKALIKSLSTETIGRLGLKQKRDRLEEYNFVIKYIKDENSIEADILSRMHLSEEYTKNKKKIKNILTDSNRNESINIEGKCIKNLSKINKRRTIIKQAYEEKNQSCKQNSHNRKY